MKHMGVKEFKNRVTTLMRDAEPVAIERHGKLIGFYVPVERTEEERARIRESFKRLDRAMERASESTGLSEDELAAYFDTSKPLPE